VRVDCHRFGWQDVGPLVAMLGAELRFPVECVYRPLNDHARAHGDVVSFHHRLLLGDDDEIGDVIRAFHKVWDHLRPTR